MTRILIVDDHLLFADGLKSILDQTPHFEIIGLAFDAKSTFDLLEKSPVDVVLLDINLGKDDGVSLCKMIRSRYKDTKVLALTMYNEESFLTEMLEQGAAGYLLKNTPKNELLQAIDAVMNGETYVSKEVAEKLLHSMSKRKKIGEAPVLSRREKEVLELIVEEHTTPEIANQLHISPNTVESHRSNMFSKLGVRNVAGLGRLAFTMRLI